MDTMNLVLRLRSAEELCSAARLRLNITEWEAGVALLTELDELLSAAEGRLTLVRDEVNARLTALQNARDRRVLALALDATAMVASYVEMHMEDEERDE